MAGKKILAVDDEMDVLNLLEKRLVAAGYVVLKTTHGKEAMELAIREHPDLIILDILMPDLDGTEVAALLYNNPKTKDIPVLFLTCLFTKREERREGHEVGHHFFVAKPYEPQDLLAEITKIVGK